MTNQATIADLFHKFLTGTEQDKAEVREFITRHENLHLLYSKEFLNAAIRNAETLVPRSDHTGFEDEHYVERCPCCGQPVMREA
jgi:hypothetical protein